MFKTWQRKETGRKWKEEEVELGENMFVYNNRQKMMATKNYKAFGGRVQERKETFQNVCLGCLHIVNNGKFFKLGI